MDNGPEERPGYCFPAFPSSSLLLAVLLRGGGPALFLGEGYDLISPLTFLLRCLLLQPAQTLQACGGDELGEPPHLWLNIC
jgi:hypothetical protein